MNNDIDVLRSRLLQGMNGSISPSSERAGKVSGSSTDTPDNVAEAARQFEEVFVRELVKVMTADLFDSGLAGDDGPGWMSTHHDQQRDVLTDVLTEHLIDSGTFSLNELMLRQWARSGLTDDSTL